MALAMMASTSRVSVRTCCSSSWTPTSANGRSPRSWTSPAQVGGGLSTIGGTRAPWTVCIASRGEGVIGVGRWCAARQHRLNRRVARLMSDGRDEHEPYHAVELYLAEELGLGWEAAAEAVRKHPKVLGYSVVDNFKLKETGGGAGVWAEGSGGSGAEAPPSAWVQHGGPSHTYSKLPGGESGAWA